MNQIHTDVLNVKQIQKKAYAKINLSLDIIAKRPDGYHEVEMVMQTIDLHDLVTIQIKPSMNCRIHVSCSLPDIPSGEANIAYKAAKAMCDAYGLTGEMDIDIVKNIPSAAGLAGGSADAAAVIKGMNELFMLNQSPDALAKIGLKVGADVPFCLYGGTMLAKGLGEQLTRVGDFSGIPVVLIKPEVDISTAWAYQSMKIDQITDRPDTDAMIEDIRQGHINPVAEKMTNVFETVVLDTYKDISELKNKLMQHGALGSIMSGSGSTVFGIFESREKAGRAYKSLLLECTQSEKIFLTETIGGESSWPAN